VIAIGDETLSNEATQTRSFCYVDDLIEGFTRLMDSPDDLTGPVNLGNPGELARDTAPAVSRMTSALRAVARAPARVTR
jgi:UDP-glucuronate decarboxylase